MPMGESERLRERNLEVKFSLISLRYTLSKITNIIFIVY